VNSYKTNILVKEDYIEKWDAVFGNRLINNNQFQELLLQDLLAEKLSLIQVGQLLLLRQGAYDKIGVYYDASASAYQIMGTISDCFIEQLESYVQKHAVSKDKPKWAIIISYFKERKTVQFESFYKEFVDGDLNSLFIDNE
jgi:hypothetical protein